MDITKKQAEAAKGLFKSTGKKELFVNSKGEFFTSENFARNSDKNVTKLTEEGVAAILAGGASEKEATEVPSEESVNLNKELKALPEGERQAFLEGLTRKQLDSLNPFFKADLGGLDNKGACVSEILKELSAS